MKFRFACVLLALAGCASAPVDGGQGWETSASEDDGAIASDPAREGDGALATSSQPLELAACRSVCTDDAMILGCDDRTRGPTTEAAALQYPWRQIGRLSNGCTGTLIGPRHVLTAAHCVDGIDDQPLGFSLAQFGSGPCSRPFGTHYVERISIPVEYGPGSSIAVKAFDYAVLELNNPIIAVAPMEFAYLPWADIHDRAEHSIGYPGSDPQRRAWQTGTNYFLDSPNKWLDGGESGVLYVNNDGTGGQSGSPIYLFNGGVRTIVGVFLGSPISHCEAGRTWAARITPETVDRIESIMRPNVIDFRWRWETLPTPADDHPNCN